MSTLAALRRLIPLALVLTLLTACGTGRPRIPPPPTYPVSGKVVSRSGQPITNGSIGFQSKNNIEWSANGEIQPDGSFSLTTLVDGQKVPGAAEGEHEVTYYPLMSEAQTEVPVTLPKPITVEAKQDNQITITVD
jgi:hypothetical protein